MSTDQQLKWRKTDRLTLRETERTRTDQFKPSYFEPRPDPTIGLGSARHVWRISMELLDKPNEGFGLDLNDDVMFGRGEGQPDLVDLNPYDAVEMGVSRTHAVMRPTANKLYLIDLNSTNGTYLNSKKIGKNTPYSITNGDVISFGHLHFTVRVVDRPRGMTDMLSKQVDLATALSTMAKAVTSQLEIREVLNQALDMTMNLTDAGEAVIWLVDEESGDLFMEAQRGIEDEEMLEKRLPMEASLAGEVISTGKSLRATHEDDAEKIKVVTGYLVESLMYVPMALGGVPFGVLQVAHQQPGRIFDERDESMITAVADFAAIAVQNARVYEATDEALRDRVRELTTLNQLSSMVSSTLSLPEVYNVLRDELGNHWDVEGSELWLLDEERTAFARLSELDDTDGPASPVEWHPVGEGLTGRVAATGEPTFTNKLNVHKYFKRAIDTIKNIEPDSLAAVPLFVSDEVVGVLVLFNKSNGKFDERDVERLSSFATPVGNAIKNATLFATSERERATVRALTGTLEQPIILIDDRGEVAISNEAAEHILESHMGALFDGIRELVGKTGEVILGSTTYITSVQHVKSLGTIILMQDISYVKQLESARTEFIYALSHDLKSPITGIRGYASLLDAAYELDERGKRFIKNITLGTDRILDMIGQLLDIAQLNESPEKYHAPFDLGKAVSNAVTDVTGGALEKGITLDYQVEGEPFEINGDEKRLYRSALNLLDNAVKYSPTETNVTVRLIYADDGVKFLVADQGPGIPEKDIPHVFERFFRVKGTETKLGIGLGLELVAATSRAHDGNVMVRNVEGGGAEFTINLPASLKVE